MDMHVEEDILELPKNLLTLLTYKQSAGTVYLIEKPRVSKCPCQPETIAYKTLAPVRHLLFTWWVNTLLHFHDTFHFMQRQRTRTERRRPTIYFPEAILLYWRM